MRRTSRDYAAGQQIATLREDRGFSRRDLSQHLATSYPDEPRMQVSDRTLARIEDDGVIPTARVKFALAMAFALSPSEIWGGRLVRA